MTHASCRKGVDSNPFVAKLKTLQCDLTSFFSPGRYLFDKEQCFRFPVLFFVLILSRCLFGRLLLFGLKIQSFLSTTSSRLRTEAARGRRWKTDRHRPFKDAGRPAKPPTDSSRPRRLRGHWSMKCVAKLNNFPMANSMSVSRGPKYRLCRFF